VTLEDTSINNYFPNRILVVQELYYIYKLLARCWWLTPVILETQEAEIRRIAVQSQSRQIVCETSS
jgi:hypothetical protein